MASQVNKIKKLSLGNVSMRKFSKCFPDQGNWVNRLTASGRRSSSVQDLFQLLMYNGDPALFAM